MEEMVTNRNKIKRVFEDNQKDGITLTLILNELNKNDRIVKFLFLSKDSHNLSKINDRTDTLSSKGFSSNLQVLYFATYTASFAEI